MDTTIFNSQSIFTEESVDFYKKTQQLIDSSNLKNKYNEEDLTKQAEKKKISYLTDE